MLRVRIPAPGSIAVASYPTVKPSSIVALKKGRWLTGPAVSLTLTDATIEGWASAVLSALSNPLSIMLGIAIAGMVASRVRRIF